MSLRRILLLAVLFALAAPASAPAALRIGIAENTPNLFSDPLFRDLGVKYTRVVASYNVMTSRDDELQRVADYVNGAASLRIEPLVTFDNRLAVFAHGIVAHARWPLHTSLLEGINNKIKVIKRMAYGFRDDAYFFLKIRAAFPGDG